ncbi:putative RTA1 domain protein [Patellaria atrata CBS 101060]|uniref:RTA1 domain protein n=1 Tax=Patellaria atrata CBS 101060 TaxID=1346257 RepID=A0A9P4S7K8_9PEZI|nr:putative RTA1 domain protein [Patellaria atrata CBS 101060]
MDTLAHVLQARDDRYRFCEHEGGECTVEVSIYGYRPNLAANVIFTAIFGLSMFAHAFQGVKWKAWTFFAFMVIGTFGEAVGYVGRILLHDNVFHDAGFKTQIICLTVAPAFLSAGVYLTLKHIAIVMGAQFSRIRPKWYTWIFMSCDIISILIQATGGAIAAGGKNTTAGNNIMIFGLVFQVATLLLFGALAAEYGYRVYKFRSQLNEATTALRRSFYFKGAVVGITVAYLAILLRCIYRVAEMVGGWRNAVMQDEPLFIALDSVMCALAVVALNAFHPGYMFVQSRSVTAGKGSGNASETEMQQLGSQP